MVSGVVWPGAIKHWEFLARRDANHKTTDENGDVIETLLLSRRPNKANNIALRSLYYTSKAHKAESHKVEKKHRLI